MGFNFFHRKKYSSISKPLKDRAVLLVVKRSRKEPRGKKGGRGAPKERMTFTGRQNESLARNSSGMVHNNEPTVTVNF